MKLVLILMVRNESKILERCLKAVENVVDSFCIHDTGSTDNTCEIAEEFLKTHKGILTKSEWKNFGYNRSLSFKEAQAFVNSDADTYGLLLDADMIFHVESLKEQTLTEPGYTIIQKNGKLHYPNTRIVRMDYPWTCKGVTHEYWDGPTKHLDVCYIQDENDGGCKDDKFTRDARLLEEGLAEEPTNVRYMFYLAQTYHSLGRWKDAIAMYKKRYNAGGWDEERWYALYMIGQSWLTLGNPTKFEQYMLRAYELRPHRGENLYKLAKYFREKGDQYKGYHYAKLGRDLPLPNDALFVETNVYDGLFEYEMTVLAYYVDKHHEGLRDSVRYLLKRKENLDNVYTNMSYYIKPLKGEVSHHPIMRNICGRDFHPSSVSTCGDVESVRFVNYSINKEGGYDMKNGNYSPDHNVVTKNVMWNPSVGPRIMNEDNIGIPRVPTHIRGLEDVRIYKNSKDVMRFIATSKEYSDKIGIVEGKYNIADASFSDARSIESPLKAECEKNWIPISGSEDIIYSWKPFRVGTLMGNTLAFHTTHETPWLFQHIRGSAIPIRVGSELWCLVHFVEYGSPRKYFHCIVSIDAKTYKPKSMCLPFVFRATGIEYCLSMRVQADGKLRFIASSWDDDPCIITTPIDTLEWIQV